MFLEKNPFPYLRQDQFAGDGEGNIIFLDQTIPADKKEWLKKEYMKWWNEREKEREELWA